MKRSFVKTPGKAVDMATSKTKKLAAGGPVANTTTRTSNVPQDTRKWHAQQARFERLANPQVYSAAARARAQRNADIQRQAQLTGMQKAEPSWSEQMTLGLNPPQNPPLAAQRPNQKARNAAAQPGSAGWSERMTLGLNPPQAAPGPNPKTAEIQEMANNPKLQALTRALSAPKPSTGPSWSQQQTSLPKPLPKPMKSGGSVRGGGCAAKGVGKGKMR